MRPAGKRNSSQIRPLATANPLTKRRERRYYGILRVMVDGRDKDNVPIHMETPPIVVLVGNLDVNWPSADGLGVKNGMMWPTSTGS